jgi:polyhydroxyalkanoate synthesis repressor PhaR
MSLQPIRIKRYPNRRYYASHTRSYISLPEIEQLIGNGSTVEIVDSQTGEDLTQTVLMQIIVEQHPDKIALFPTAMLHAILRANSAMSEILREYFLSSITVLDHLQAPGFSMPPQPMNWLQAWLDTWATATTFSSANPAPKQAPKPADGVDTTLANRIAQLENRIAELETQRSKKR